MLLENIHINGINSYSSSTLHYKCCDLDFYLAVLKNRLNVNFDYLNRKTFDMVRPGIELPVVIGINVPNVNNADVESKWHDHLGKFGYSIRGVLSDD